MVEHMFDGGSTRGDGDTSPEQARRAELHALLDQVLDASADDPGAALADALGAWHELSDAIDGRVLTVVPSWHGSMAWAHEGDRSAAIWLANHLGIAKASAASLRRVALDLAPMPHGSAAARDGELSFDHLRLLTRARRDEVAEAFDRDEPMLVAAGRTLGVDAYATYLANWYHGALAELGRNEPDGDPPPDTEHSTLRLVRSFQGRGLLTADLTPEDLATLLEAIDARVEGWRRSGQLAEDDRSSAELAAAALVDLIADGSTSSRRSQPRPLLVAVATLAALFDRADVPHGARDRWRAEILGGGPIGRQALRRLIEQANLQLVVTDDDGEPLHVGRAKRLATAAMLAALIARSGGRCEFPGCHATHHRCHAHHLTWWEQGGETAVSNLVLICPHHHRLVHQRGFTVARGPTGLTWTRPDGTPIQPPPFQAAA